MNMHHVSDDQIGGTSFSHHQHDTEPTYRVVSISRIDNIVGLFCKRNLKKGLYSAKETCSLIDPTDRSHPIAHIHVARVSARVRDTHSRRRA